MWQEWFEHHGKGVLFILEGAQDNLHRGLALFPEILKSELREVRATIEAHSNTGSPGGHEDGTGNGYMCNDGNKAWSCQLRVTTGGARSVYILDRWD